MLIYNIKINANTFMHHSFVCYSRTKFCKLSIVTPTLTDALPKAD